MGSGCGINSLTLFVSVPTPDEYMLNPDGMAPDFDLRDGLYISAAQLGAASGQVISKLRTYGFKNTAILDEGVLVWTQMGLFSRGR